MSGGDDWANEARRHRQLEQNEINLRLQRGEWIALEEAIDTIGILPNLVASRLGGYQTRGRLDLLSPDYSDIPPSSWDFLTLRFEKFRLIALSVKDGRTVYDILVALRRDPPAALLTSTDSALIERAAAIQRSTDLEEFFSDIVKETHVWRLADYGTPLSTVGLALTNDGKRVRVSMKNGAVLRNEGGKTALATILLGFFYRKSSASMNQMMDNRSRARSALNWLKEKHPDLVHDDIRYSQMLPDFLDETHRKLHAAGFLGPRSIKSGKTGHGFP